MISLPESGVVDLLGEVPDGVEIVEWDGLSPAPPGIERVEFFVGLYNAPPPDSGALSVMPDLRVVQLLSAGVDAWLPLIPDGVTLCNGRGIHGASTAELAVAGMLASLRRLPELLDAQRRREWARLGGSALAERRVLVIGAGDIGRRIGAVAEILDAEVTYVARTARDGVRGFADLPALLPRHDVVVLAVPLTPQTRQLADAAFLAAVPDGALLVNIARGPVVDTDALCAELTAGRLHAYLDVTDPEPLPADHPLWAAPNLLLTPHVAGGTAGWLQRGYGLVGEQVRRYVAGEELANRVGPAY